MLNDDGTENMQKHTLELSQSIDPNFCVGSGESGNPNEITPFELSLLCGAMVHPTLSFSVNNEGTALSIEWEQEFPI